MDCIRVLQRFSITLGNFPWGKPGIAQQHLSGVSRLVSGIFSNRLHQKFVMFF